MLSVKLGSIKHNFLVFGMTRPRIEPLVYRVIKYFRIVTLYQTKLTFVYR